MYGKRAKKEAANVISYFLMTREWHPCSLVYTWLKPPYCSQDWFRAKDGLRIGNISSA